MEMDPKFLKELIITFNTELDEQLEIMTNGLLQIEKEQTSENFQKIIEAIFRAAHNIKGSARGIGVDAVGDIAHHIESLFLSIKKHEKEVTTEIINLCLDAVDTMRLAMQAFIDNLPPPHQVHDLLCRLAPDEKIAPEIPDVTLTHQVSEPTIVKGSEYESIRIPLEQLEQVSAMIDEIQINKIAIDEHYANLFKLNKRVEQLAQLWKQTEYTMEHQYKKEISINLQRMFSANTDELMDLRNEIRSLYSNMRPKINELTLLTNSLQTEVRTLRLVPAKDLLRLFPRSVRDLAHSLNKKVELITRGEEVRLDKIILDGLRDPLMHLIRNAIDHGIELPAERLAKGKPETGSIYISFKEEGNSIYVTIRDDGVGINTKQITSTIKKKGLSNQSDLESMTQGDLLNYIFMPGFSTRDITTDVSGRGVGLDVVKENLDELKGSVNITTEQDVGTTFTLRLPLTLTSERGLMINCGGQTFALLINNIERVLILPNEDIVDISASQAIRLDNKTVPLRILADILGMKNTISYKDQHRIVVLKKDNQLVALLVDDILGEREIVIKPLQPPLYNVLCTAGGTLSGTGEVIIVLNAIDLLAIAINAKNINRVTTRETKDTPTVKPHVLIVDDSITTRTMEKNILESKNYQVTVAVNGKEAWDLLQKQKFSLLITDVSMPIMDGFTLTERVKSNPTLRDMPVIIVTSLDSVEEKKRGADAGANAYIVKSDFESDTLLEIVSQLV